MPNFKNEKGEEKYFSKEQVGLKRKIVIDGIKWEKIPTPPPPSRYKRLESALEEARSVIDPISEFIDELNGYENPEEPFSEELKKKTSEKLQEMVFSIDISEIECLRDEIENWKSGMEGTNLENSSKYSDLEECYDSLENGISELEDLDFEIEIGEKETPNELAERMQEFIYDLENAIGDLEGVNFPGMF